MDDDTISRKAAVNALWKALYAYEDKTEKQFQESEDLDIYDWMVHRVFVQNMSDIDRRIILDLPSTERHGRWIHKKYRWIKSISMWWSAAYECSICGEAGLKDWSYCPNCGAKME
jgi:rubrerythrin